VKWKQRSVLPGFGLTMGFTLLYLSLIVLIPLGALVLTSARIGWSDFWRAVSEPAVVASYKLSFGASLAAAAVNVVFGFIVAWVLVRYSFPGRKFLDAIVDLPFALPTAVSGIVLTSLYRSDGWIGRWLLPLGIRVSYTRLGVAVMLVFIGLPFVVRTLQPALEDLDPELEEAAASLGAPRWATLRRVILPGIFPALLAGFALALARGLGEYGSVVFISGNRAMETQITPFLIVGKLEQFDYAGATAIGVVMLTASFLLLLIINLLQWWSRRYAAG
jgi:sulfate transport system permease protein